MLVRTILYAIIVVAFAAAGTLDLLHEQPKAGVLAYLSAVITALIFFWR